MLHIALWEPEIPPNTGNIARLCAATGTRLHLIGKLGFKLDDRSLRRAGLDYWHHVDWVKHETWEEFALVVGDAHCYCFSAHATKPHTSAIYQSDDFLLFGCESKGLPASITQLHPERLLTIPMPSAKVRSLNLSTSAGIVLYEALRQLHKW